MPPLPISYPSLYTTSYLSLYLCPRCQCRSALTPPRVQLGPPPLSYPRVHSLLLLRPPLRIHSALRSPATISNSEPLLTSRLTAFFPKLLTADVWMSAPDCLPNVLALEISYRLTCSSSSTYKCGWGGVLV